MLIGTPLAVLITKEKNAKNIPYMTPPNITRERLLAPSQKYIATSAAARNSTNITMLSPIIIVVRAAIRIAITNPV